MHTHQALRWHTNHEDLHQEVEIDTPQICHAFFPGKKKDMAAEPSMPSQCFGPILPGNCWLQHLQPADPSATMTPGPISTPGEVISLKNWQEPPTSMAKNFRTPCSLELGADLCRKSGGYMNRTVKHQLGCTKTQLQGSMPAALRILGVRAQGRPTAHQSMKLSTVLSLIHSPLKFSQKI